MSSRGKLVIALLWFGTGGYAAQDAVSAVEGTVTKVDGATKTAVVKAADGTGIVRPWASPSLPKMFC